MEKITLNADELIQILKGVIPYQNNRVPEDKKELAQIISDYKAEGKIYYDANKIKVSHFICEEKVIVKSLIFDKKIEFEQVHFKDGLEFEECYFNGGLDFISGEFNSQAEIAATSIYLKSCDFVRPLNFRGGDYTSMVLISYKNRCSLSVHNSKFFHFSIGSESTNQVSYIFSDSKIDYLSLGGARVDTLRIKNVEVKELTIGARLFASKIEIENCLRLNKVQLLYTECGIGLEICSSKIQHLVLGVGCRLNKIELKKTNVYSFIIVACDLPQNVFLNNCYIYRARLEKSNFNSINIDNSSMLFELTLRNAIINKVEINKSKINRFLIRNNDLKILQINKNDDVYINEFKLTQSSPLKASITNCQINYIEFKDSIFNKETEVTIIDVKGTSLNFINFINQAQFYFIKFKLVNEQQMFFEFKFLEQQFEPTYKMLTKTVNPTITTTNSSLGKIEFIDCDFEKSIWRFKSSKLMDIFIAGTKLPQKIEADKEEEKRLGYGQLKKVLENRGDTVEALNYYAKEMDSYSKQLEGEPGNCKEKIVLWMNNKSNAFGTDWLRGIFFTLGITWLTFFIYCLCFGIHPVSPEPNSLQRFLDLFAFSLRFIIPIEWKQFTDLYGKENAWASIVNFVGHIFISYGLYQTIQAFRKHGKKAV